MTIKYQQQQQQPPPQQPGYGGYMPRPGQYSRTMETGESQTKTPKEQALLAIWARAVNCLVVTVAGIVVYAALKLVIGRWAVPAVATLVVLVAVWYLGRKGAPRNVVSAMATAALVAVGVGGWSYAAGDLALTWQAWAALALVWFVVCLLWCVLQSMGFLYYRETAEIVDPYGPTSPRIGVLRFGPWWPGTPEPEQDAEQPQFTLEDMEAVMRDALQREPDVTRIVISRDKGNGTGQLVPLDIDVPPSAVAEFARGLLAGREFTSREWTGRGKLLSRRQFNLLRTEMLLQEWAEWESDKDPRQGVNLTEDGLEALEQLAQIGTAPPQQDRPTAVQA